MGALVAGTTWVFTNFYLEPENQIQENYWNLFNFYSSSAVGLNLENELLEWLSSLRKEDVQRLGEIIEASAASQWVVARDKHASPSIPSEQDMLLHNSTSCVTSCIQLVQALCEVAAFVFEEGWYYAPRDTLQTIILLPILNCTAALDDIALSLPGSKEDCPIDELFFDACSQQLLHPSCEHFTSHWLFPEEADTSWAVAEEVDTTMYWLVPEEADTSWAVAEEIDTTMSWEAW
eukprot:g34464.t1